MVDHADTIFAVKNHQDLRYSTLFERESKHCVYQNTVHYWDVFSRDCYFFSNTSVRHSKKLTDLNADALSSALESMLKYVCLISVTFTYSHFMSLENHVLSHVYVLWHYPLIRTQMMRQINEQTTRNWCSQMILQVVSLELMLLTRQLLLGFRRKSQSFAQFSSQFLQKYQNSHPTNKVYNAEYQENSMKPIT